MTKITKARDSWGDKVIYVEECSKYLYEKQEVDITQERKRLYDILYQVENYYSNS